jgi:hypothetical protein
MKKKTNSDDEGDNNNNSKIILISVWKMRYLAKIVCRNLYG